MGEIEYIYNEIVYLNIIMHCYCCSELNSHNLKQSHRRLSLAGHSLGSSERPSEFKVIVDLSSLGSGRKSDVVLLSLLCLDLDVDVRDVVN